MPLHTGCPLELGSVSSSDALGSFEYGRKAVAETVLERAFSANHVPISGKLEISHGLPALLWKHYPSTYLSSLLVSMRHFIASHVCRSVAYMTSADDFRQVESA